MTLKRKLILIIALIFTAGMLAYYIYPYRQVAKTVAQKAKAIEFPAKSEFASLQDGDIIFQTSKSNQSKAIQLATHSKFSHMGIVYKMSGKYFVYEAAHIVRVTPIEKWSDGGEGGHFVVKRINPSTRIINAEILEKLKKSGSRFAGKNYDPFFEWSDTSLYCSELVWKMYKEATGLELGSLQKLREFDLTDNEVKKKMKERFGTRIPLNERVISPSAIFESDKLITVTER